MDADKLRALVERIILCKIAESGERFVPVASSNRHVHLCRKDVDLLFSPGYRLTKLRDLSQTGQYACKETVMIETPKGRLQLRVLGPERSETQIELSMADAIGLGIAPAIRMSGDINGTPGAKLAFGNNVIELRQGVIVARRHIHMSPSEAKAFGLSDGGFVSLVAEGARPTVFRNVAVRVHESFSLEAHIDRDEANAAALRDGALCRLIIEKRKVCAEDSENKTVFVNEVSENRLITEKDIKEAQKRGVRTLEHAANTIITPLARDAARKFDITLKCGGGL